ncbi:MAG: HTH domain-containing protein [Oscillospiraceae bacterium]|nr:HTH domain-containing protein [Oscillospiraceae bacterium]
MDRLSRVISIMIDLINKEIVDTSYLADKYEVSTRTIYRDIDLLNLSGIPIISERGKNGGFSILEGFKIDKSVLTETEFSILLRGIQTLVNNQDKEAQVVYDKLLSILANSKKEKIVKKSNNVVIDVSPLDLKNEVARTLQRNK